MRRSPASWFGDAKQFLLEVRSEFRKVTWPTRKEAAAGTVGVVVVVAVITGALSLVDLVLGRLVQWVLG